MSLALLAQKPIGTAALGILLRRGIVPRFVVTNSRPDGTWWGDALLWQRCGRMGIQRFDNAARNEGRLSDFLDQERVDILLSVQHPWILSPELLDVLPRPAVNLHLAPLPEYKGSNCAKHAIADGATEFGWTIHEMVAEVDTGPIVMAERFPVDPSWGVDELYQETERRGALGLDAWVWLMAGEDECAA